MCHSVMSLKKYYFSYNNFPTIRPDLRFCFCMLFNWRSRKDSRRFRLFLNEHNIKNWCMFFLPDEVTKFPDVLDCFCMLLFYLTKSQSFQTFSSQKQAAYEHSAAEGTRLVMSRSRVDRVPKSELKPNVTLHLIEIIIKELKRNKIIIIKLEI